ncbi:MAG: ABC transporter ATP-binding protein [Myxococcales bacterium]|nr:ABC transporter ATP-binding protein [Myxococcales bacterium]
MSDAPLVKATNLVKHFPITGGILGREVARVHAVNGVNLEIHKGECVGLVGESGCGKSTLGKTLVRLLDPTSGKIEFAGTDIGKLSYRELRPLKKRMQMIFQDPYGSLNPRMTIETILSEALFFHAIVPPEQVSKRIDELLELSGLSKAVRRKYPHEFSGGQRQRVGIARALTVNPEFILADEPVSALDVSVQAQILNLLNELRGEFGLSYLFVSHDLKVVQHFCERVLIMYLGYIVEELPCDDLEADVQHPYSKALLGAIPVDDPRDRSARDLLEGDVPSPITLPTGCPFHTRCPDVEDTCKTKNPELISLGKNGHRVACHAVE